MREEYRVVLELVFYLLSCLVLYDNVDRVNSKYACVFVAFFLLGQQEIKADAASGETYKYVKWE